MGRIFYHVWDEVFINECGMFLGVHKIRYVRISRETRGSII